MGSILTESPLGNQSDPNKMVAAAKGLVDNILNSANPQATFQQILNSNQNAKNAMDAINEFGNGDPRQAFMNYANAKGKQTLAQQIMQGFLSKFGIT